MHENSHQTCAKREKPVTSSKASDLKLVIAASNCDQMQSRKASAAERANYLHTLSGYSIPCIPPKLARRYSSAFTNSTPNR